LTAFLALTWCATEILQLREQIRTLQAVLGRQNQPPAASRFAEAIYNQSAIINERILQLPENVTWVDDPARGNSLFERDCYKKLWEIISAKDQTTLRFSICGNPGIGKSWFLFYVMYQLALQGTPMVYAHTISAVANFKLIKHPDLIQTSTTVPSWEMNEVLRDSSAWYLVDGPVNVGSLSFIPINARVLQVTSPDRQKFKEFLKAPADQYFMPVWTHDELEECRARMYPKVSPDELMEFERIAGRIPRYVLEDPFKSRSFSRACEALEKVTKAALCRMPRNDIALAIGADDIDDGKASYRVLQIEVDLKEFKSIRLGWASPFVEEQFFSRMMQVDLELLWMTYEETLGSMKGIFFETWAHRILVERCPNPMPMLRLKNGNSTQNVIGKRTLLLEQTYEQMTNMDKTMYGVPASRTFPAIDAVCLPYFFQMTIQPAHSIKLKPFAAFVYDMIKQGKMMQDEKIKLVFVVPPDVFDQYTTCVP
jgi:hypothetical protein